jgi:prepilin-type processing-associated H-X9-DG protein
VPDPGPVAPLEYAAPGLRPHRTDYAAGSLIVATLGILLLCMAAGVNTGAAIFALPGFLCIPTALVLGILGLRRSPRKGRAIAGILLASFVVGILLLLPNMGRAREPANRIKCSSNLRQIGYGIQLYANENNGLLPPSFGAVLLTQDLTSDVFICPSSNEDPAKGPTPQAVVGNLTPGKTLSYVYLYPGPGKRLDQLAPATVLAYEVPANHDHKPRDGGAHFLYADGNVDYVVNAQKAIDQLKAGQNPPVALTPSP